MQTLFVGPWDSSEATALLPASPAAGRVLIVESDDHQTALPHHRKKLVLVRSALRHFRDELRSRGYLVDHRVARTYADAIRAHLGECRPSAVIVPDPAEWGVARSLAALAAVEPRVKLVRDRRFLTPRAEFAAWARGRKLFRMEDFYRRQRRRLHVLVDGNGDPVGGRWNLDQENRRTATALRKHGVPPAPLAFAPDAITRGVMDEVAALPHQWGEVAGFDLPVTRADALLALDDFLVHRLPGFGPFEDAMLAGETYLYHSRLSAAMNVGLLHADEIVQAALRHADRVPLASLEGFIRQVIGWREYVNGIYWLEMPGYRDVNHLGAERPLPQLFWEPERTDLACLRDTVRTVHDTAYAHHIHRLMILCNFATLAGIHPLRLSEWFWAGFADAWEWVELPNVVGMGTFGDGGRLASKPYVSAAAYIQRMSDYCTGCRHDPSQRTTADACPFNYLYWSFLDDLRRRNLDAGGRMALVFRSLERIPPGQLETMRHLRAQFLARLEPDRTGWRASHDQG